MMVFNLARRRGFPVDRTKLQKVVVRSLTSFGGLQDFDRNLQGSDFLNPVNGVGQRIVTAASLGLGQSVSTGVIARLIARRQRPDGHWTPGDDIRPPQSFSPFTTTANALRVLQLFLPETMAEERNRRVRDARAWLERTLPLDNEDRVYQLFGLHWAGSDPRLIRNLCDQLLAEQRPDGGWGQISSRASDAYATGEALAALLQAGHTHASDPAYQRGLRYLLSTQKLDGTWFVASRLHPPGTWSPPYFETGLPYGHDQSVSAMGTSWAAAALLLAIPESSTPPDALDLSAAKPGNVPAWAETLLFGSIARTRQLVDTGWNVNSATASGTTALMMAAADFDKTSLLIERGANVQARSKTRYTAVMIAASHHATDSVRLLLDHKAEAVPPKAQPAQFGSNPLILSVYSGDLEAMKVLQSGGAPVRSTMLAGGLFPVTPLNVAVMQGDLAMVEALLRGGTPLEEVVDPDDGVTSLGVSVVKNDTKMASLLLTKGADVNHVDKLGYTPLLWAAASDFGDSAMLQLLLGAGANRNSKNPEGLTALELATKYKYERHRAILAQAGTERAAAH